MKLKRLIGGAGIVLSFALMRTGSPWRGVTGGEVAEATTGVSREAGQDEMAAFRGNECVWCHSRLANPLKLTSRYAEWHISTHRMSGVACDKCHGGRPGESDQQKAHTGMLPAAHPESRLNPKNLATTCQGCHQPFVAAYTESSHYKALKGTGLGPSCNTCHGHMASEVIYTPEQAGVMCATCHDSNDKRIGRSSGLRLPRNPGIALGAQEAIQSIRRAGMIMAWADRLLEEAGRRKMATDEDRRAMAELRSMMNEAKAGFHTFEMARVRERADGTWTRGMTLRDSLRRRLYPNQ